MTELHVENFATAELETTAFRHLLQGLLTVYLPEWNRRRFLKRKERFLDHQRHDTRLEKGEQEDSLH